MQWDTVNEVERKSQADVTESGGHFGPGKRYGLTLNAVSLGPERTIFAIGGTNAERKQTIGVCRYDTGKELWKRPKLSGVPPAPRENHSCTTVGTRLFVWGGRSATTTLGDLNILDAEAAQWVTPEVKGDPPDPREGHTAALVKDSVYIFGGCTTADSDGADDVLFDDVYKLDTGSLTWHKPETTGERPSARTGHSMVAWNSCLVVFGGQDAEDRSLNDVHVLDTDTLVWSRLQPCGEMPAPRAGHVSALVGNQLVVFGGVDKLERKLFNDIYVLDLGTLEWRRQAARGSFPGHRFSAPAALVDDRGGDLLIYGGCDENLAPTSGFFVLLTGLAQPGADVMRLAKHQPRPPLPPSASHRPSKRRKTVIPTLSGHHAKVDEATAALYFQTLSRIAERLKTGARAPGGVFEAGAEPPDVEETRTGGSRDGDASSFENVCSQSCSKDGVLLVGEQAVGGCSPEQENQGVESEGNPCVRSTTPDGGPESLQRCSEVVTAIEGGLEVTDLGGTAEGVHREHFGTDARVGDFQASVEGAYPGSEEEACVSNGRGLVSSSVACGPDAPERSKRGNPGSSFVGGPSSFREGLDGDSAPVGTNGTVSVQGGRKILVSAGVQTIYSAVALLNPGARKKLDPIRRRAGPALELSSLGDLSSFSRRSGSPTDACAPVRSNERLNEAAAACGQASANSCHGARKRSHVAREGDHVAHEDNARVEGSQTGSFQVVAKRSLTAIEHDQQSSEVLRIIQGRLAEASGRADGCALTPDGARSDAPSQPLKPSVTEPGERSARISQMAIAADGDAVSNDVAREPASSQIELGGGAPQSSPEAQEQQDCLFEGCVNTPSTGTDPCHAAAGSQPFPPSPKTCTLPSGVHKPSPSLGLHSEAVSGPVTGGPSNNHGQLPVAGRPFEGQTLRTDGSGVPSHPPTVDVSHVPSHLPTADVSSGRSHPRTADVSSGPSHPPTANVSSAVPYPPTADVSSSPSHLRTANVSSAPIADVSGSLLFCHLDSQCRGGVLLEKEGAARDLDEVAPCNGVNGALQGSLLSRAEDSGPAAAFGGWALIKVPEIEEEPPRDTIDIKIEDLLQSGFSISADAGGQALRGFLFSSNPKFLAIAQGLALKKCAEDQRAAAIAAAERKAARIVEKKEKEARKLEAARVAEEVARLAAAARAERKARSQPPRSIVAPRESVRPPPVNANSEANPHENQTADLPADRPVVTLPVSTAADASPVVSPPVKVLSPVPPRKGKKKESGAKGAPRGGRSRTRPAPPRGYLASYPPNMHLPVAMPPPMPVLLHPHVPYVIRPPPAEPVGRLPESMMTSVPGGATPVPGHETPGVAYPPTVEHAPETESLGRTVGHVGETLEGQLANELEGHVASQLGGHVAEEEGLEVPGGPEHTGQELMEYEEPVMEDYGVPMDGEQPDLGAAYGDGAPGELDAGQPGGEMGEEQADATGDFSTGLETLYPTGDPPFEEMQDAFADPGEGYTHQTGYETGQPLTEGVFQPDGQPGYAQGHVVYEHPPTAYYAHDPYYGTYQMAADGTCYQHGHVPYHPQYAMPEYQGGYLTHPDPYGQFAPVAHPVGAYGMQGPPIHYGAPVYGPVQPATASAIDPTHVTYQQQMYNMQVYGTPYDPSQWSAPPTQ